jgi:energy-coupling factor transport system ATP-binding protein
MKIRVEGLSYTYPSGVTALRDIDLRVDQGEAVALVGENGAGKTTLAKNLNGLLRPSAGRVWVGDWDTRQRTVAELAHRVAFVFQNPDEQLFERTVAAEVAFGPRNLGASPDEVERRVEAALRRLDLLDQAQGHPYDLHPSQRRRVTLAAALAMETPIIVLDEPTTGQDAHGMALVASLVERAKTEGRSVIAISHDVDFCAEHFERIVVLSGGRILADGPGGDVLSRAQTLAEAAIEQPQLVRLASEIGWAERPLSVEAFVDRIAERRQEKGSRS